MLFEKIIKSVLCIVLTKNTVLSRKLNVSPKTLFKNSNEKISSGMKVLNVAEKNDAAKNIANILSKGSARRREGFSVYNKIYEFNCDVFGRNNEMVMTSVSGHLLNWEFNGAYRGWQSCQPVQLFDAPVFKNCTEDAQKIKRTLEREVRACNTLIIWTDCDREGENIGFEIISVCKEKKPNITVYRAKFSEITRQSVLRSLQTLEQPNKLLSEAVDVRSELDLRIGAAFTRFQTLRLKRVFPEQLADCLISYGSCQFPTLGFVVERYNAIQNFVPEKFWKIRVDHKMDELNVEFSWKRVRLFDEAFCRVLFERCLEKPVAKVENIVSKPKSKWRPVPLDTVEFEKLSSRKLGLNAKAAMKIAEKLYTQGFISYPRTETTIFPKELNLANLVQQQTADPNWGAFANRVMEDGPNPRQGKKTDEAHPPIHPTKYTDNLTGDDKKIYEFVVRHFLACVSKDAKGHETIVDIDINGEKFVARGLMILERNYLEVYPYEKWSDKEIHIYQMGQTFHPTNMSMVDGTTSPPNLLTEADLIALMEKHGIGTDATHAEHIETIKSRLYVGLTEGKFFVPGQLGMGLVEGYDSMGFAMSKPHLRAELEADLKRICEGTKDPKVVLSEQIMKYKEVFIQAQAQVEKIDTALGKYLDAAPQAFVPEEQTGIISEPVMKCPSCGSDMVLRKRNTGGFYISCLGFPQCKTSLWFPSTVVDVKLAPNTCPQCGPQVRQLIFNFRPGALAPYYPNNYTGCVNGCDSHFLDLLNVRPIGSSAGTGSTQSTSSVSQSQTQNSRPTFRFNNNNQQQSQNSRTPGPVALPNRPSTQQISHQFNEDDEREVECNCGLPAKRLIVQKESVNKGRPFYKCGKNSRDESCNFFQWGDGQNNIQGNNHSWQNQGGRGAGGSSNRGTNNQGTGGGQRKCGICHRTGHTRRNCPNA
ncbi:topoisomerase 3-alpha isoform X2 [Lycorma delicatula]|uniref:topoisomerase 3-alpha isoform X2 n=1 Tax=Lycorma delicatula TaxID=130591 RepID=UPI003F5135A5